MQSWCLVEVPRYVFYAVNLFGESYMPFWLKWVRYSLFMILYPTGISGEILCIWKALPLIESRGIMSISMPNAWNFSFSYFSFMWLILLTYAPGSPHMFLHMLKQRSKALYGPVKAKTA